MLLRVALLAAVCRCALAAAVDRLPTEAAPTDRDTITDISGNGDAPTLRYVGQFPVNKPAFITVVPRNQTGTATADLIVSAFGVCLFCPSTPDTVYGVRDVGRAFRRQAVVVEQLGESVPWPNEVSLIDDRLVVAGGFLVPGARGHISSMSMEEYRRNGQKLQWEAMVAPDEGFYHRVEKVNVYGRAGGERLVSCRGWKNVFGGSGGHLEFLERRADGSHMAVKIADGCDVYFATVDLNGDGIVEFVVPEFFGQRLRLIWTEHPDGDYSQPEFIRQRIIDGNIGAAFDVQMVDLDGDEVAEILATNHQGNFDSVPASVFAYTVTPPPTVTAGQFIQQAANDNNNNNNENKNCSESAVSRWMQQAQFERHTLASDFKADNAFMSAAPGSARAVVVAGANAQDRPHVFLSGDGTNKAYMLVPDMSRPAADLAYKQQTIHECKGIVGFVLAEDVDGDGHVDVLVPCYDANYVAVYTYAPPIAAA